MAQCSEAKCQENYAKMKALRKCLKQEVESNKALQERVKELEISAQSKDDTLESLQMNNQRLVMRIETLQSKEKSQPESSGGGGGWGFSFGGNQAAAQELAKIKEELEVAQEELEAKMVENCKSWIPEILTQ